MMSAGKKSAFLYSFLHLCYAATLIGNNIWLSEWTNDAVSLNGTVGRGLVSLRLGVYGGIAAAQGNTLHELSDHFTLPNWYLENMKNADPVGVLH